METMASTMVSTAALSTMRTMTLGWSTHLPSPPTTIAAAQLQTLSSHESLSVPLATVASSSPLAPDLDFDMGTLPWPPLWLTVFAFALTLVAAVTGVAVWAISSPPNYGERDGECEDADGEMEADEWWEGKGEHEEEEADWAGDDADDDAVELKRLLSDAPPPTPKLVDEHRNSTTTVNKRNFQNLRLDLSATTGLGVGSWGRGVAGYDSIDSNDIWERKCQDYGIEGQQRHADADDETSSLFSLSLASTTSSALPASGLLNKAPPDRRRTTTSTSKSTKPVFDRPLRGWRKAIDDRVGDLACWIEAYVADGGSEKALLCKVTREERGDVVYGFEY